MTRNIRIAAVHLALAAMMLRAFLPAGWMPNLTGSGEDAFVVCTMDGPVRSTDAPGKPSQNDSRSHETCPFAAAPHLATPVLAAILPRPSTVFGPAHQPPATARAVLSAAYAPQAPRAPPAFV